ncbi:MAG: T9SS type A sorting domain-containing protein, partial [Bacteroidetes bacterium]|nr:T9SS type A sorting domain-containing protein [Bacteroidota bacterium]
SANYGFFPGLYSTVTFNGTADQFLTTACAQEDFNNLTINKSAGKFRPSDNLQVLGDILISNGSWEDFVSGLSHSVYSDFTVAPTGAFLTTAVANTVEFKGSQHSNLNYAGATGYFRNLLVNKGIGYSVNQIGNASCQNAGNLTVNQGYYFVNGNILTVTGNIAVNTAGYLSLAPSSLLTLTDTKSLNVNSGGRLELLGTSINKATIAANVPTSHYNLNVNTGGSIAADYAIFKNMGVNGISVGAGATVDLAHPFKGCTFQDGAAGGTLLTLNRNADFPTNTWTGSSNVTKTPATGHVYFLDFTGGFSGEAFDADANNLIDWVAPLTATATATPAAVCAGSSTQLNITRTGGVASFTYLWSPATGLSSTTVINPTATPLATTTYFVTVTDALGTTATSSILVTVNPILPVGVSIVASANPSPPNTFVNFTATPVNGGVSPSYQWKVNGNPVGTGLPSYSYKPAYHDQVTCALTSNYACPSGNPATSNTITMVIVATNTTETGTIPSPLDLCFDASNTITVAGGGSTFIVESGARATMIAGVKISYLYGTKVNPNGYMHGYITTTNAYCGSLLPSMLTVVAGEEEVHSELLPATQLFTIYPNPTSGKITISNTGEIVSGGIRVEIFNMRGDRVFSTSYTDERNHAIVLSDQSPGLYFVKVITVNKVESFKLIVTR